MAKKSSAFDYFSISEDGKYFVCLCKIEKNEGQNCNATISTFYGCEKNVPTRTSNIKRHLQRHHANIYETVCEKDKKYKKITFCNFKGYTYLSGCNDTIHCSQKGNYYNDSSNIQESHF